MVQQFLVVLTGTEPLVWRRIQVPDSGSFWDLHVAIQDAMGWQDCHLHEFRLTDPDESRVVSIGIPMGNEAPDRPVIPGWQVRISRYFEHRAWHGLPVLYAYDFGDEWEHVLVHETAEPADRRRKYPRCIAGARRCPPEDCGGPLGYRRLLQALADRRHPEHRAMAEWVGAGFDPDDFTPARVRFDDPKERWRRAFGR